MSLKNFKLSNNVLAYYEPSIEDGKIFLFNAKENVFWEGNNSAYIVIQYLLEDYVSLNDIKNSICKLYPQEYSEQINHAVASVIDDLYERNFLETLK